MHPLFLAIPDGFDGRIEVLPHPDQPDGRLVIVHPATQITVDPAASPTAATAAVAAARAIARAIARPEVEHQLDRYMRLNPNVWELFDEMTRQGFRFYVPEPRSEDDEWSPEYLRAVFRGVSRRLTLYINSSSLTAVSAPAQEAARELPGTEMLPSGAVFRYNVPDGVERAMQWTAALIRWATCDPSDTDSAAGPAREQPATPFQAISPETVERIRAKLGDAAGEA